MYCVLYSECPLREVPLYIANIDGDHVCYSNVSANYHVAGETAN